jgi:hypothetical protein
MSYKTGERFSKNGANQERAFPNNNEPMKATYGVIRIMRRMKPQEEIDLLHKITKL